MRYKHITAWNKAERRATQATQPLDAGKETTAEAINAGVEMPGRAQQRCSRHVLNSKLTRELGITIHPVKPGRKIQTARFISPQLAIRQGNNLSAGSVTVKTVILFRE